MLCKGRELKGIKIDTVSSPFDCLAMGMRIEMREEDRTDLNAELRIHERTERGDNDTVKMPNGQRVVIDGKKCSDR
jgi:hypothetical protein